MKPHSFCETPHENCTLNYCDENGCLNRKRELLDEDAVSVREVHQYNLGLEDGYSKAKEDLYTKQDLIDLVQGLKDYTKESHTILGHDDREPIEFVDIFLNEISDKKRNFVFSDDQDINSKNITEISEEEDRLNKFNGFISTEVALKFLTKEQGERLKWYYETYLANEIQGGIK